MHIATFPKVFLFFLAYHKQNPITDLLFLGLQISNNVCTTLDCSLIFLPNVHQPNEAETDLESIGRSAFSCTVTNFFRQAQRS